MANNKFYITTPIYYPNSKPHVGTLYSTLLADVTARFQKLMGKEVFFMTGTDEHGQKLQEAAENAGKNPKEFIDEMIPNFTDVWKLFEIEYDKFIRTTDPYHEKAVQDWLIKLHEQGDIYKSTYSGQYCVPCETFVTINSDTPQDEKENYLCPSCERQLREVSEESYFFRLSAYEDQLLEFYESHPNFIVPKERMAEVVSFVKSGLKDLSISRKTVSWGIPFPGDPEHTVYVWGDALNNYITGIGYGQDSAQAKEQFAKWWPADMHVMAKDIVRFHAVYWPAFLMAANLPLPKKLMVHGYILTGQSKMSKSKGNAVSPTQLAEWYGVEQVRYYLLRQMPISHDGNFELKDLEGRIGSDLANNLGNLLNRTISLAQKAGFDTINSPETWEAKSSHLRELGEETFRSYWDSMNHSAFHVALSDLWKFISHVNAFFHEMQPWVLAKQNKELFEEVIAAACNSLYMIALMGQPFMPKKMEALLTAIGQKFDPGMNYEDVLRKNDWNKTFVLKPTKEPLFVRPESRLPKDEPEKQENKKEAKKSEKKESVASGDISINDFAKVQQIVGTILSAEPVEGSDKLLKMQVDLGPLGKRQILSGVAQFLTPSDLVGKQGIVVANLPPRKMVGTASEGMLVYAKDDQGNFRLVTVSGPVADGTRIG